MAPTVTIDGYDLASLVLWGDRQHDFGQPLAPQFGGNVAFNDGQPWVRTSASNREWTIPLLLTGTTDSINSTVRDINSHLYQGAQFQFKAQGATNINYFDLEEGFLDPHWDLYEDTAGALRATLHLATRPYATTGTTRLLASVVGSGVMQTPATGILGDVAPLTNVTFTTPSQVPGNALRTVVAAVGIARSASYVGFWPGASMQNSGFPTTALIGASGAVASQYLGAGVPAPVGSAAYRPGYRMFPQPAAAYTDRARVIAIVQNRLFPATSLALRLANFSKLPGNLADMGPTAIPGGSPGNWQLVDLGEWSGITNVPSGAAVPTESLDISVYVAGGASVIASPAVRMNGVVLLPVANDALVIAQPSHALTGGTTAEITAERYPGYRSFAALGSQMQSQSYDLTPWLHGNVPQPPLTGSPIASGAPQIVALVGIQDNYLGNEPWRLSLSLRERFSYLR